MKYIIVEAQRQNIDRDDLLKSDGNFIRSFGLVQYTKNLHNRYEITGCELASKSCAGIPVLDHCHQHGWIRGIICHYHNVQLGHYDAGPMFGRTRFGYSDIKTYHNNCPDCYSCKSDNPATYKTWRDKLKLDIERINTNHRITIQEYLTNTSCNCNNNDQQHYRRVCLPKHNIICVKPYVWVEIWRPYCNRNFRYLLSSTEFKIQTDYSILKNIRQQMISYADQGIFRLFRKDNSGWQPF